MLEEIVDPLEPAFWAIFYFIIYFILIILGAFWLIFGQRLFRVVLFLNGLLTFSFLALQVFIIVFKDSPIEMGNWIIHLISLIIGLIAAILFCCGDSIGRFFFGLVFGVILGNIILLITHLEFLYIVNFIILIVIGITFGVLSVTFVSRLWIIFSTSVCGAYIIGSGIDAIWPQSGFFLNLVLIVRNFSNSDNLIQMVPNQYIILGFVILLIIFGIFVQIKLTAHEVHLPNVNVYLELNGACSDNGANINETLFEDTGNLLNSLDSSSAESQFPIKNLTKEETPHTVHILYLNKKNLHIKIDTETHTILHLKHQIAKITQIRPASQYLYNTENIWELQSKFLLKEYEIREGSTLYLYTDVCQVPSRIFTINLRQVNNQTGILISRYNKEIANNYFGRRKFKYVCSNAISHLNVIKSCAIKIAVAEKSDETLIGILLVFLSNSSYYYRLDTHSTYFFYRYCYFRNDIYYSTSTYSPMTYRSSKTPLPYEWKKTYDKKLQNINSAHALLISSFSLTPIPEFENYGTFYNQSSTTSEKSEDLELIREYTIEKYQTINQLLQDTIQKHNYNQFIHKLNRIIKMNHYSDLYSGHRRHKLPEVCFRLTHIPKLEFKKIETGKVIYFPTFVYSSRKILNTGGNTLVMIKIEERSRNAIDLSLLSAFPSEEEILFALNVPFRVVFTYQFSSTYSLKTEPEKLVPIKQILALVIQEDEKFHS